MTLTESSDYSTIPNTAVLDYKLPIHDIFSKETQYKLAEILVNYKPYESKQLKGNTTVKHKENKFEEFYKKHFELFNEAN